MTQDRRRQTVLTKVRDALGGNVQQRRAAADSWMNHPQSSAVAQPVQLAYSEVLSNFVARARAASAIVETICNPSEIPKKIEEALADGPVTGGIVASADPVLEQWLGARPRTSLRFGCPVPSDAASITIAAAAIAETGTLVFVSGPLSPASLAFLPELLIALVPASRIVVNYDDAVSMLLRRGSSPTMPRCVNFVTGPSRTADIEEVLLVGAHGPRSVKILVVEGA